MSYYNQNNYASVPYPHATRPNATVKSSGCGVCCMSMVVEGLTGKKWPPAESAKYSISVGARAANGTDMGRLSRSAAQKFGLTYKTTSNVNDLVQAVKGGAWAIANVGGDRGNYVGLFSDGGHYVVVIGMTGGKLVIWDPMMYAGKFNKAGRAGKVTVSGNEIYCVPEYLDRDCDNRWPRYYIFEKEEDEVTQADWDKMMENWLARRNALPQSQWSKDEGSWAKLLAMGILKNDEAPQGFITRQETAALIDRVIDEK